MGHEFKGSLEEIDTLFELYKFYETTIGLQYFYNGLKTIGIKTEEDEENHKKLLEEIQDIIDSPEILDG